MTSPELITHVEIAIQKALRGESKLDAETLAIGGFSTATMRRFFNNVCSEPVKGYLEVGAFRGASCCAAACNNRNLNSVVIEDFSQPFGEEAVRDNLIKNLAAATNKTKNLLLVAEDCWHTKLDPSQKFDVMFYDGEHSEENQARALPHFFDQLSDSAIVLVDDYEWGAVKKGTWRGFDRLFGKCHIDRQWVFTTNGRSDDPIWHNGLFIAVISKIPQNP